MSELWRLTAVETAALVHAREVSAVEVARSGMIGTLHESRYPDRGHDLVSEFYADLEYGDDGNLIITQKHDAFDASVAASNCRRALEEGKVASVNGKDVAVRADSICVHSDTPNAVELAEAVRSAIQPFMAA